MSWLGGGSASSSTPPPAAGGSARPSVKKVYYLGVLRLEPNKPAVELVADTDLSSFSIFSRPQYTEFIHFGSKTVAERTPIGNRKTVAEKVGDIHSYHLSQGFCVVLITETIEDTKERDSARFAFQGQLSKVADAFRSRFTPTEIASGPVPFNWPEIKKFREESTKATMTGIGAVQAELDETKYILHQTIENVLQRGEKLDVLVQKSDDLGAMSKGFYKQAKNQNSCCVVM